MKPKKHLLKDNSRLVIRQAAPEDAGALLEYIAAISGQSDYLTFGPGEFVLTVPEEEAILHSYRQSDNQLYMLGLVDGIIVSALSFSAGRRPRVRHSGECSMSVRKEYWGQGIGGLMLDALIAWAQDTKIIRKINLRVRKDNRRAIRLYQGRGFVTEGIIRKEIFLDGKYFDLAWMGLEI
ncbi:GNAT family N-acetyltransferase [Chloroflexota bacterium]